MYVLFLLSFSRLSPTDLSFFGPPTQHEARRYPGLTAMISLRHRITPEFVFVVALFFYLIWLGYFFWKGASPFAYSVFFSSKGILETKVILRILYSDKSSVANKERRIHELWR